VRRADRLCEKGKAAVHRHPLHPGPGRRLPGAGRRLLRGHRYRPQPGVGHRPAPAHPADLPDAVAPRHHAAGAVRRARAADRVHRVPAAAREHRRPRPGDPQTGPGRAPAGAGPRPQVHPALRGHHPQAPGDGAAPVQAAADAELHDRRRRRPAGHRDHHRPVAEEADPRGQDHPAPGGRHPAGRGRALQEGAGAAGAGS